MNEHLISSKEMAQFVGIRFTSEIREDGAELNRVRRMSGGHEESTVANLEVGTPFEETWPKGTTSRADLFRLPQV